tara:strand:+ start:14766 stop:15998 length:1233 start_codon:yes stop_codon:yes gene_type:complete
MFKGLFDFRNQRISFRWSIITPVLFFVIVGLFSLSSTSDLSNVSLSSTFYKQCVWFLLGIIAFFVSQFIRLQFFYDCSYIFYFFLIFLIGLTMFAPEIKGAKSWLVFGPIYFQPSELGKIFYVSCMARFFSDNYAKNDFSFYLFFILVLALIPPLLVIRQPDLGTAISYLSIILPILYWSNTRLYVIFFIISPIFSIFATYQLWIFYLWMFLFFIVLIVSRPRAVIAIFNFILNIACAISAPFIWDNFLEPHQQKRILTFLNPMLDPLGAGYQVIQSMISIGSGGFWGQGLGDGTQTHLKFLPVQDSDFIISVTAEEMGFKIIFLIIFFIAFFVYWCFIYASKIENRYVSTLIVGCATIIYSHMIINLGMISGLLPVTGLPAPFISYGGSFFLTCSIILGIINNAVNNNL